MPSGIRLARHRDILTYEEILRLCGVAVSLGIVKFKVTGGDPLVRKGCADFVSRLKTVPGVEQVTLTTNGILLADNLDALRASRIDGINISLDTVYNEEYRELTGYCGEAVNLIKKTLAASVACGLRVKINAVLLSKTFESMPEVASLAQEIPVDVRLIELMPIGEGATMEGVSVDVALERLREKWPDLRPTDEIRGNGPAKYYTALGLKGKIGFIDAVSHRFCDKCNRVRLTGTGALKPCLCYSDKIDLKVLLRGNCSNDTLREAMRACIEKKPFAHCFPRRHDITEANAMNRIGG
jgi:cyclic pyranopterin phosphate synthase